MLNQEALHLGLNKSASLAANYDPRRAFAMHHMHTNHIHHCFLQTGCNFKDVIPVDFRAIKMRSVNTEQQNSIFKKKKTQVKHKRKTLSLSVYPKM